MNEASKTRRLWGAREAQWLKGEGLDIGCGPDPVKPDVTRFDVEDGDANCVLEHVHRTFDFVFSSHSLEHMADPPHALRDWWQLVRSGGHLVVVVPDEDLYEQGYFPSIFNPDHKATFTIAKRESWSPKSINLLDLAGSLEGGEVVSIELQDAGYDRRYLSHGRVNHALAYLLHRIRAKAGWVLRSWGIPFYGFRLFRLAGLPVDQTEGDAVAQIQVAVRKRG
jgi:SAM-dependent methyltransferase